MQILDLTCRLAFAEARRGGVKVRPVILIPFPKSIYVLSRFEASKGHMVF